MNSNEKPKSFLMTHLTDGPLVNSAKSEINFTKDYLFNFMFICLPVRTIEFVIASVIEV